MRCIVFGLLGLMACTAAPPVQTRPLTGAQAHVREAPAPEPVEDPERVFLRVAVRPLLVGAPPKASATSERERLQNLWLQAHALEDAAVSLEARCGALDLGSQERDSCSSGASRTRRAWRAKVEELALRARELSASLSASGAQAPVWFSEAVAHVLLAQHKELIATGKVLIGSSPMSHYVPYIFLFIGDVMVRRGTWTDAKRLYARVMNHHPGHEVLPYARLRAATCYKMEGSYARALDVASQGLLDRTGALSQALRPHLRAIALVSYAHAGAPDKAQAFFARLLPEGAWCPDLARAYREVHGADGARSLSCP